MAYNNQPSRDRTDRGLRINERIRVREVRLIDDDGGQGGVLPTIEALNIAKGRGLDLVEVSPMSKPPVCKIMDYGKFKFDQEKKLRESKKNQKVLKFKEVRMQPKISSGDLDIKAKHIEEFLKDGCKVKVTIRFRGRELAHTDLGLVVLEEILKRLTSTYIVEKPPLMEGKSMSMTIAVKK